MTKTVHKNVFKSTQSFKHAWRFTSVWLDGITTTEQTFRESCCLGLERPAFLLLSSHLQPKSTVRICALIMAFCKKNKSHFPLSQSVR